MKENITWLNKILSSPVIYEPSSHDGPNNISTISNLLPPYKDLTTTAAIKNIPIVGIVWKYRTNQNKKIQDSVLLSLFIRNNKQ